MLKGFVNIGIDAIVLIIVGSFCVNRLGAAPWLVLILCVALGIAFYIANSILINYFIAKHSPEMASHEKVFGDTEMWELTAGLGIVPKWVSYIGLWSMSAFVTSFIFLVWSIITWVSG